MPVATIFSGIAWCYGDNDFIIQSLRFQMQDTWLAVRDLDSHVTCSTDQIFAWLVNMAFYNSMQLQGSPIDSHTFVWVSSINLLVVLQHHVYYVHRIDKQLPPSIVLSIQNKKSLVLSTRFDNASCWYLVLVLYTSTQNLCPDCIPNT